MAVLPSQSEVGRTLQEIKAPEGFDATLLDWFGARGVDGAPTRPRHRDDTEDTMHEGAPVSVETAAFGSASILGAAGPTMPSRSPTLQRTATRVSGASRDVAYAWQGRWVVFRDSHRDSPFRATRWWPYTYRVGGVAERLPGRARNVERA